MLWPDEGHLEDEDDGVSIESKCQVMGYLRQFVTTGDSWTDIALGMSFFFFTNLLFSYL